MNFWIISKISSFIDVCIQWLFWIFFCSFIAVQAPGSSSLPISNSCAMWSMLRGKALASMNQWVWSLWLTNSLLVTYMVRLQKLNHSSYVTFSLQSCKSVKRIRSTKKDSNATKSKKISALSIQKKPSTKSNSSTVGPSKFLNRTFINSLTVEQKLKYLSLIMACFHHSASL